MNDHLIIVDWGTTNFRAYLVDRKNGVVLDEISSGRGIRSLETEEFPIYCSHALAKWRKKFPLPVYLSGMVGAKRGWIESPQPNLPITLKGLARHVIPAPQFNNGWILPGVKIVSPSSDGIVDVMRGEEVQAFGTHVITHETDYACCLPGTHSKWVRTTQGQMTRFITMMTGELYQAVLEHTLPGEPANPASPFDEKAFLLGVKRSASEGGLLHALFEARSRYLYAGLSQSDISSYISGVMIGEEIKKMSKSWRDVKHLYVIGSTSLTLPYTVALKERGYTTRTISSRDATVAGVAAVAHYHQELITLQSADIMDIKTS